MYKRHIAIALSLESQVSRLDACIVERYEEKRRKAKNASKMKKSQQTALSRKKPVFAHPDEEKPVCAVLGRKIPTDDTSRD